MNEEYDPQQENRSVPAEDSNNSDQQGKGPSNDQTQKKSNLYTFLFIWDPLLFAVGAVSQ